MPISEVVAEAVSQYPISQKTIELVRALRCRRISVSTLTAEQLDAKIARAGGKDVTRSEVLDFILQQGLGCTKGSK